MILKFTKAGNISAKSFSSEKLIETNNIFTIRGKDTFLFQLRACKQQMQLNTFLTVHIKTLFDSERCPKIMKHKSDNNFHSNNSSLSHFQIFYTFAELSYPASRGPSIFLDKSGRGRDLCQPARHFVLSMR